MKHEYVAVTDWDTPHVVTCDECRETQPLHAVIVNMKTGAEFCSWRCAELDWAGRQNMEVDR